MALRRLLLYVVDPASAHLWERRPRARVHREAAVFGPGLPSGGRQATPEEIERLRASRPVRDAPATERSAPYHEALARMAEELVATGRAELPGGISARVIRFWRGDSLLEVTRPGSRGCTRVPRRLGPEDRPKLAAYLAQHLRDR